MNQNESTNEQGYKRTSKRERAQTTNPWTQEKFLGNFKPVTDKTVIEGEEGPNN